ncbi:MAG TPA: hypothetical protein VGF63_07330 [Solirubrobacteraceae bacterium]|jgi:hypothetical protein
MSARIVGAQCARHACHRPARQHGICMLCWLGASQLERRAVAWDAHVGRSIVEEAELVAASVVPTPVAVRRYET